MSEYQSIINVALGAILMVAGWFSRILWEAVNELQKDLSTLRVEIARDYLPRNDFNRLGDDLKEMLNKIYDRLDNKADK